jgi:hypothetical protein
MRLTLALLLCLSASAYADNSYYKTQQQLQVGGGPAFVQGLNTPYMIEGWRAGYGVQFDPRFDIQLVANWAFSNTNTDMHYFAASFASNYYFSEDVTSPYVTADLGYAGAHAHHPCTSAACEKPSDNADGLALGVGAGITTLRGSGFNVGILAHYQVLFDPTGYGTPMEYTIQAMLYY